MSELNFIKYNINGKTDITEDLVIRLNNLGFNIISESKNYKSTMWACNQCILLVSRDDNMPTGINGFGFNSSITPDGSVHCDTTGMNKFINKNGHEIYTYPIEKFKDNYDEHFNTIDPAGVDVPIEYFAGVVYNTTHAEYVNEFNESLNFRTVKKSDDYTTSVCPHNRFSVMWNTNSDENKIDTLIIKTDDIVDVVSKYVAKGFETTDISDTRLKEIEKKYKSNEHELPPRHLVNGWDLNIGGKSKSYVLEKSFPQLLPNVNVIVSQRHNHNGLNEESIKYYNEDIVTA